MSAEVPAVNNTEPVKASASMGWKFHGVAETIETYSVV